MMGASLLATLALAYAGMLGICLGKERHWKQLAHPKIPARLRQICAPVGGLMLAAGIYFAQQVWPGGMALVGLLGLVSLAGFALLMLIPYAPRLAAGLPLLGGLASAFAALI